MKKIYHLQHYYEYEIEKYFKVDQVKMIGIYSSKEKAEEKLNLYKSIEGFKDHPKECFYINESILGRCGWGTGFVQVPNYEEGEKKKVEDFKGYRMICDMPKWMTNLKITKEQSDKEYIIKLLDDKYGVDNYNKGLYSEYDIIKKYIYLLNNIKINENFVNNLCEKEESTKKVYSVYHRYEDDLYEDVEDKELMLEECKIIGFYKSEEDAKDIIDKYKLLEGFKDYPNNFYIYEYIIDKSDWSEGFTSVEFYK